MSTFTSAVSREVLPVGQDPRLPTRQWQGDGEALP